MSATESKTTEPTTAVHLTQDEKSYLILALGFRMGAQIIRGELTTEEFAKAQEYSLRIANKLGCTYQLRS